MSYLSLNSETVSQNKAAFNFVTMEVTKFYRALDFFHFFSTTIASQIVHLYVVLTSGIFRVPSVSELLSPSNLSFISCLPLAGFKFSLPHLMQRE